MNGNRDRDEGVARDTEAGELLRDLREQRGLSPEQVPHAMRLVSTIDRKSIPSSRTIRRIEDAGVIPQVRHRFALAEFYGRPMGSIWESRQRVAA